MRLGHYDMVIVGGGLAGSSLALAVSHLHFPRSQKPLQIAIIETKPFIKPQHTYADGRYIALSHGSAQIYQSLGLWEILAPIAYPLDQIHVSERGSFGLTRFKASAENVPALAYVIPLAALQETLITALQEKSHIHWFCPDTVVRLQQDNPVTTLQLAAGLTLSADLVIAADGTDSVMRRLLGIKTDTHTSNESALITTLDASKLTHTAYQRFSAQGVMAVLPIAKTRAVLIWTGPSEWIANLRGMDNQSFLRNVQSHFGYRAGKLAHPSQPHVFPLQWVLAEKAVQKGVVLIGHAAHTIYPLAAQGFNLSLRDLHTLARLIEKQIISGESLAHHDYLAEYVRLRTPDQKTIIRFTRCLSDLFAYDLFPFKIVRNVGLLACDLIPPIKTAAARKAMGISG